jgi:hypothetical protein
MHHIKEIQVFKMALAYAILYNNWQYDYSFFPTLILDYHVCVNIMNYGSVSSPGVLLRCWKSVGGKA